MITDVHTHIPSHQNKVPESEERYDKSMQSGSQYKTKLTNSIDDYLKAMEKVKISFIFGTVSYTHLTLPTKRIV